MDLLQENVYTVIIDVVKSHAWHILVLEIRLVLAQYLGFHENEDLHPQFVRSFQFLLGDRVRLMCRL